MQVYHIILRCATQFLANFSANSNIVQMTSFIEFNKTKLMEITRFAAHSID